MNGTDTDVDLDLTRERYLNDHRALLGKPGRKMAAVEDNRAHDGHLLRTPVPVHLSQAIAQGCSC